MTSQTHTYGPTCYLARPLSVSGFKDDDAPPLKTQFFYSSPLPIDDPLAAIPPPAGDLKSTKYAPRPFSAYDNNALEEAWLGLGSSQDRKNHQKLKNPPLKSLSKAEMRRASFVSEIAAKHNKKHAEGVSMKSRPSSHNPGNTDGPNDDSKMAESTEKRKSKLEVDRYDEAGDERSRIETEGQQDASASSSMPVCCSELENDVPAESHKGFGGILRRRESKVKQEKLIDDIMKEAKKQKNAGSKKEKANEIEHSAVEVSDMTKVDTLEEINSKRDQKNHKQPRGRKEQENYAVTENSKANSELKSTQSLDSHNMLPLVVGSSDIGTTGTPFQRAPSRGEIANAGPSSPASRGTSSARSVNDDAAHYNSAEVIIDESERLETIHVHHCKAHKKSHDHTDVPVGISRLHLVKLPALTMMPIYWSPIQDIAVVSRGTWFYKADMCPVEPAVANQLEMGYRELRPWSQTWADELNSAIEVGAAGEEKIAHQLWPKESDKNDAAKHMTAAIDPYCAAKCFHGEVAAIGSVELVKDDEKASAIVKATGSSEVTRRYPNCQVIFRDSQNAYILKPNLQPSAYYGRRPLAKITKNITVGIHVVRGFDRESWEKLQPSSHRRAVVSRANPKSTAVAGDAEINRRSECPACREDRPKVTDLVLVVHGIGQKLSERVESFHFTHAINSFRRSINVELANESVQKVLRKDLGGVMVLPVNWRANLSFEDGGSVKSGSKVVAEPEFSLKDITPETIPAVRNLITDVMLDIPFYMSSHKPKMVEALVLEANRVYRLWCRNNPDFQKEGRVHLIAHSLGSAMAMDVLSKQPTTLPQVDVHSRRVSAKHFEFDTKSLFFAGSPAAFFLLLDNGNLIPRKGRNKPDADQGEESREVSADAGRFGCLAVDNLYNVMQVNDPIAYRLNATVDPFYAATLKDAYVPSATTGFFESVGNTMRSIASIRPSTADLGVGQVGKPAPVRMPSQLEMEVHDFTREEIAEKKFYLLNDNGQVDYFLSPGAGILDLQYVNMLGAHSSYWSSPDFVRLLVTEVGRKPGKTNTLPNMRAAKKGQK